VAVATMIAARDSTGEERANSAKSSANVAPRAPAIRSAVPMVT
jgi:hypothetical protein